MCRARSSLKKASNQKFHTTAVCGMSLAKEENKFFVTEKDWHRHVVAARLLAFLLCFRDKSVGALQWERRVIYADGDNDALRDRRIVGLASITDHQHDRIRLVSL